MPKVPADNVVRHEIVLGKAERELARNTLEAYQFNKFATPIVAGLSDVTFTLTVATLAGFAIGRILDGSGIDPNWREIISDMTNDQVKDWFETQNLVGGGIGFILGSLFLGGPLIGGTAGAVAGSATVEGLEFAEEVIKDAGSDFFAYLGQLHNQIEEWAGIERDRSPGDVY